MVSLGFSLNLFIVAFCCFVQINCQFEEYYKWKQITFATNDKGNKDGRFPKPKFDYIPSNNLPMGATRYKERIFVTLPRRRPGIPATLNVISAKATKGSSPSYKPFPNAEMNRLHTDLRADPTRLVSVYRTRLDDCNRLWWIDTGMLEYPNNNTQVQRPMIWVYDLESDAVVHRFEIPESIVKIGKGMASITVDVNLNDCQNAYGYIPDLGAPGLYVYSLKQNRIWRFQHNYFHFDPLRGDFNVVGIKYQWDDGLFSITLGNRQPDGYRTAYFHAMASISEFAVSTQILQNEANASKQPWQMNLQHLGNRGPYAQSAMHEFDSSSGVIFYSQVHLNGIGCWNSKTKHTPNHFHMVASNNQTMIYPGDITIDKEGNLWVVTNSMPRFLYDKLNPNEYNFRLWRANVRDILRNSPCSDSKSDNHQR